MTMTEQTPATPKPKSHRRANRRKPARAAAAVQEPDDLKGLTPTDCPLECSMDCCVITGPGKPAICGHPFKGGLQSRFQNDTNVLRRFQRARTKLADAKVVV